MIVVVCGSYLSERHMEKKGQMLERWHLPFRLVFLLLSANDRLVGAGGVVRFRGIFGISFLRVSINTLLCYSNLIYSENLLSLFLWT